MKSVRLNREIGRHGIVLFSYLLLVLILTWPLAQEFGSGFAGSSTDALLHYWNGWWVRQAITTGQSPFHTTMLFYPQGASLVYHNFAWMSIIPWLALQTFLDGIIAYNVVFIMNLMVCGYAAFYLVRRLTGSYLAAFTAGVIYLAWPYRLSQLDHPNLISTGWVPFLMLFIILVVRRGRWRDALAAGILLAIVGFTRWQLLPPVIFIIGIYLLVDLRDWMRDRQRWLALAAVFITAAVLLAVPAFLLIREQSSTNDTIETLFREGEEAVMQTDLLAYLTPSPDHPLIGSRLQPAYESYYPDRTALRRFPVYIGFIVLGLVILGIWTEKRKTLPWLVMALFIVLLSLGPVLRLNGNLFDQLPTLYRLLEPLVIFRLIRDPERYNILLALPIAVLSGYGAAALLDKGRNLARRPYWLPAAIAAFLCLLILIEYVSFPVPIQTPPSSIAYDFLAGEEDDAAVLSLPIDPIRAKEQMYAQTIHGRPLLHGHISRLPAGVYHYIDSHPLLGEVRRNSEMPPWLIDVGSQMDSLKQDGIGYITLHKDQIGSDRIARWRRYLVMQPILEDENVVLYSTEVKSGENFEIQRELAPGVGPVNIMLTADCYRAGQPMEADIAWGIEATSNLDYAVRLAFIDGDGQAAQTEVLPLAARPLKGPAPSDSLLWGYYPILLEGDLQNGAYSLVVSLDEASLLPAFAAANLEISDMNCPNGLPESAGYADALFGTNMRLLGYEIDRPMPDRLDLTLYWRGEQRMEIDHKVFVHVFPEDSDVPAAQDDSRPHRGGFPTQFWAPGDSIYDNIPVDLAGVTAGHYRIAVGVYDPLTMTRLPLTMPDGSKPDSRRYVLPGEILIDAD